MFTKAILIVLSLVALAILLVVGAVAIFIGAFVVHDVKTKIEKDGPHFRPPDNSPPPPRVVVPPGGFRPAPTSRPEFPTTSPWVHPRKEEEGLR